MAVTFHWRVSVGVDLWACSRVRSSPFNVRHSLVLCLLTADIGAMHCPLSTALNVSQLLAGVMSWGLFSWKNSLMAIRKSSRRVLSRTNVLGKNQ